MNLSDSKKKLALAGVICGLVAACLAFMGNPANMAFCIACFIRDTAGALGMPAAYGDPYVGRRFECMGCVDRIYPWSRNRRVRPEERFQSWQGACCK